MRDKIYKMTSITATSSKSYEDAIKKGISKTAETVRNMAWFQVDDFRGAINPEGEIEQFQARLTIAFEVD